MSSTRQLLSAEQYKTFSLGVGEYLTALFDFGALGAFEGFVTKFVAPEVAVEWYMDYADKNRDIILMPEDYQQNVVLDDDKFEEHVSAHCSQKLRDTDRLIRSQFRYVDFGEFYAALKRAFLRFLREKSDLPYVFVTGHHEKSGYWCTLLLLLLLKDHPELERPFNIVTYVDPDVDYLYVFADDISYSGAQMRKFLTDKRKQYVPDTSIEIPDRVAIVAAATPAALQILERVGSVYYSFIIPNVPADTSYTAVVPAHKYPDDLSLEHHFFHSDGAISDCGDDEKNVPFLKIRNRYLGYYTQIKLQPMPDVQGSHMTHQMYAVGKLRRSVRDDGSGLYGQVSEVHRNFSIDPASSMNQVWSKLFPSLPFEDVQPSRVSASSRPASRMMMSTAAPVSAAVKPAKAFSNPFYFDVSDFGLPPLPPVADVSSSGNMRPSSTPHSDTQRQPSVQSNAGNNLFASSWLLKPSQMGGVRRCRGRRNCSNH